MSTTPMHRPFLVGHTPAGPHLVFRAPGTHGHDGRDTVYGGLHLVPTTGHKKAALLCPLKDQYRIAAVAAALFLVLTVV